jgi:Flp pilus assembly pilin Flp
MRSTLTRLAQRLHRDDRGLTTVEYVIVLCLIAAVAVGTWQKFGTMVNDSLTKSKSDIATQLGVKTK